jgi:hypothetical protein
MSGNTHDSLAAEKKDSRESDDSQSIRRRPKQKKLLGHVTAQTAAMDAIAIANCNTEMSVFSFIILNL